MLTPKLLCFHVIGNGLKLYHVMWHCSDGELVADSFLPFPDLSENFPTDGCLVGYKHFLDLIAIADCSKLSMKKTQSAVNFQGTNCTAIHKQTWNFLENHLVTENQALDHPRPWHCKMFFGSTFVVSDDCITIYQTAKTEMQPTSLSRPVCFSVFLCGRGVSVFVCCSDQCFAAL